MADTILTFDDFAEEQVHFLTLPRRRSTPLHTSRRATSYVEYLEEWHRSFRGVSLPAKPDGELPVAEAYVNCGRWVWKCICETALIVHEAEDLICVACGMGGWRRVVFPENRREIEAELMRLPGHRLNAPLRQWQTMWTMDYLRERVAKADALVAEGQFPRALSIGATRVWATGEVLTAANMNTFVSQILDDIAGRNGVIEFEDSISFLDSATNPLTLPRGTTAQRPATPALGMMRYNTTLSQVEYYNGIWTPLPTDSASFAALDAAGLVGPGADQFAIGNHSHSITIGASGGFNAGNISSAIDPGTTWDGLTNSSVIMNVTASGQRVALALSALSQIATTWDVRFRRGNMVIQTWTGITLGINGLLLRSYIDNPGVGNNYIYTVQARHTSPNATSLTGASLIALRVFPS